MLGCNWLSRKLDCTSQELKGITMEVWSLKIKYRFKKRDQAKNIREKDFALWSLKYPPMKKSNNFQSSKKPKRST